ncbi:hypothetical protein BDW22DRAFT_1430354 [Trametopsis cervina]|nr:hypothetical protein BDW22DRAFT_1430354 [Trametopsis cervina]
MSSTEENNSQSLPAVAAAPFNHPSADVLFVSADGVEFWLHRVILSLASPFFDDMFSTLPTSDIADIGEAIPVPEDSKVFDYMMRFCYPVHHAEHANTNIFGSSGDQFMLMTKALEASVKYELQCSSKTLASALTSWHGSVHGPELYPLFCRLNLEEDAQAAAECITHRPKAVANSRVFEQTLNGAYWSFAMSKVTAAQYFRLLHYLRAPDAFSAFRLPNAPFVNPETRLIGQGLTNNSPEATASLIASYLDDAESASTDVVMVSYDGFELPAHTLILRLGSAAELLANQAASDTFTSHVDDLSNTGALALRPRIHIPLSGRILADLLSLCYNQTRWQDKISLERVASCVEAASRFHITKALDSLRRHVTTQTDGHPLAVYFIAEAQGWAAEAKAAAVVVAKKRLETQYTPEMEDVPAVLYHRLLHFCHRFTVVLHAIVQHHIAGWNYSDRRPMSTSDRLDAQTAHIVARDDAYQQELRQAILKIDLEAGLPPSPPTVSYEPDDEDMLEPPNGA